MRAGYLQFKPEFGDPEKNILRIKELISGASFDLIVLPELSNSGYLFCKREELEENAETIPDGKFCKALKDISRLRNGYIVSGICEREGDNFYNSSLLVHPDGNIDVYRKIHLFDEEKLWFKPGNKAPEVHEIVVDSAKVKIGMMICFDWIFPETARTLALKGAQIICHPSNLVLQYCQQAMFTRAVENRVFTITANRTGEEINCGKKLAFTGESVIVSPSGEYLGRGTKDGDECLIKEINPELSLNKNVTSSNDIVKDRRPEFYF